MAPLCFVLMYEDLGSIRLTCTSLHACTHRHVHALLVSFPDPFRIDFSERGLGTRLHALHALAKVQAEVQTNA